MRTSILTLILLCLAGCATPKLPPAAPLPPATPLDVVPEQVQTKADAVEASAGRIDTAAQHIQAQAQEVKVLPPPAPVLAERIDTQAGMVRSEVTQLRAASVDLSAVAAMAAENRAAYAKALQQEQERHATEVQKLKDEIAALHKANENSLVQVAKWFTIGGGILIAIGAVCLVAAFYFRSKLIGLGAAMSIGIGLFSYAVGTAFIRFAAQISLIGVILLVLALIASVVLIWRQGLGMEAMAWAGEQFKTMLRDQGHYDQVKEVTHEAAKRPASSAAAGAIRKAKRI